MQWRAQLGERQVLLTNVGDQDLQVPLTVVKREVREANKAHSLQRRTVLAQHQQLEDRRDALRRDVREVAGAVPPDA